MGLEERTRPHAGSTTADRPHARADWRQMLAIGVIASILGIVAGLLIDWFPLQASTQAPTIDTLWDVLLIASIPVFVGVMVVVLFSVWKFRMRPGEELRDGPPIHGNTRLEVIWTAIPAILLVGLCTYAFIVLQDVEAAEPNTMNVRVVGEQFAWTFYYDNGGKEVASPQLHLPVNQSVEFTIQSKDVLHDFWVPAFRMKKDAVPGLTVTYRVTPNRTGSFPIVCAELCGAGHATMRASAVVESPAQFTSWLGKQGRPAVTPAPGGASGGAGAAAPQNGKQLFTSNGCGGCHTLKDAGANATVGPDLDKVLPGKPPAFIKQSIVDPGAEVENGYQNIMPPGFGDKLGAAGVDALVKYLSDVTKGG
jgi:cytochrome c oxidase subunit 2